jgi:hypothetical protein
MEVRVQTFGEFGEKLLIVSDSGEFHGEPCKISRESTFGFNYFALIY